MPDIRDMTLHLPFDKETGWNAHGKSLVKGDVIREQ